MMSVVQGAGGQRDKIFEEVTGGGVWAFRLLGRGVLASNRASRRREEAEKTR